ncbi:11456_t:CDS:2 [Paraglomus brasilianum]|uniref:11456_t:CDS:1 n=1 Tax=Paraglomus brasilianum TaxID=144538 RepID=A0A9N9G7F6_9GLOM|nr:11456_t:CDS:2 [Paraglomus brasilianum]
MPSVTAYALISILFTIDYFLGFQSLIMPNWLVYVSRFPLKLEIHYGLFKKCSSVQGCYPFPSPERNDCDEEWFCELWNAARFAVLFAAFVGAVTWLALVVVMLGGRGKRERMWGSIAAWLMFHAFFQFTAVGLIAYLFNNSDRFYFGYKYDMSFIFATISGSLSVMLSISLVLNGVLVPSRYDYLD